MYGPRPDKITHNSHSKFDTLGGLAGARARALVITLGIESSADRMANALLIE